VPAHKGGRAEDVDISKALIAETKAQAAHLERQIEQTIIRSPDHGVISKRDAHIGNITSSGTPLFSIIRLNRLELRAQVSDLDLHKFKVGQQVVISTREGDKSDVTGKIWLVSPQVDQASRLGTVRVELPSNAGLKPGMFVRGQVSLGQREAITVPVQSLVTRNGESVVFKLGAGNHAESTVVETGASSDTWVEINSGLKPGDVVIARGARFLSDRDVVQVGK
jgi:HlyD family secretion protein